MSLDLLSNGRAILGVGLGHTTAGGNDYLDFQVPVERRIGRFKEQIDAMKALWTRKRVTYEGQFCTLKDTAITLKSPRKPHMCLWLGGTSECGHPGCHPGHKTRRVNPA